MRKGIINIILGVLLAALGVYNFISGSGLTGLIPFLIGASLIYLGFKGGRTALIVFGHACIVVGCMLVTWGIYLLPHSEPTLMHIFARPLFWGLISIFGGICANYHGFCACVRRSAEVPTN